MYRNNIYHFGVNNIPHVSLSNKCIVLDLDQTLVATQDEVSDLKRLRIMDDPSLLDLRNRTYYLSLEEVDQAGSGTTYDFWGVTRPHVQEFLLFCFSYFRVVAVWSAGQPPYVEGLVDYLFRDLPPPHVVLTAKDIVRQPPHNITTKPLTRLFDSNPVLRRYMSLENTLALDDNPSTFSVNPRNGVLIPPYNPTLNRSGDARKELQSFLEDDSALLQFRAWLTQPEVLESTDLRELDKSRIFSRPVSDYNSSEPLSFVPSS